MKNKAKKKEKAKRIKLTIKVSKLDSFVFILNQLIYKYYVSFMVFLSGFLIGRVVNEFSVAKAGISDVLRNLFSTTDRTGNYVTWAFVFLLVITPFCRKWFAVLYKKRQYEKMFETLVQRHIDPSIAQYNAIGWNKALSLQTCPELHRGWQASDVQLQNDTVKFSLPEEFKKPYDDYYQINYEKKRFFDDGLKIMLKINPASFSDSPTLVLDTQESLYSQIQFYRDNVAINLRKRNELIHKVYYENNVLFPHALCMHTVVVTKDDKVLITKRSSKVAYYPDAWSCSIEEQFSNKDIEKYKDKPVLAWFERALKEELGIGSEAYNKDNLRILSVFLESDILNVAVCAHAVLDIDSARLDQVMKFKPRTDYEFTEWKFLTHKELSNELFNPTRPYHPTSGYRMLLALIRRFGEPQIASDLFTRG